jgi:hypothetical protein
MTVLLLPPPIDDPVLEPRLPPPPEYTFDGADPRKLPDARPPDLAASASSGDPNINTTMATMAITPALSLRIEMNAGDEMNQIGEGKKFT